MDLLITIRAKVNQLFGKPSDGYENELIEKTVGPQIEQVAKDNGLEVSRVDCEFIPLAPPVYSEIQGNRGRHVF